MRGASLHTLKGVLGCVVLKDNVCRAQALACENKKADELSLSGFLTYRNWLRGDLASVKNIGETVGRVKSGSEAFAEPAL